MDHSPMERRCADHGHVNAFPGKDEHKAYAAIRRRAADDTRRFPLPRGTAWELRAPCCGEMNFAWGDFVPEHEMQYDLSKHGVACEHGVQYGCVREDSNDDYTECAVDDAAPAGTDK